jgi:hypothetical protein
VLVFAAGYLAGPVLGGVASLGLSFLAVTGVAAAAVLGAAAGCNRLLVGR